jgi:ribosomal protein L37E
MGETISRVCGMCGEETWTACKGPEVICQHCGYPIGAVSAEEAFRIWDAAFNAPTTEDVR